MSEENQIDEIMLSQLLNTKNEDDYYAIVSKIRERPSQDTFEKACRFAKSDIVKEKIIGVDILVQLGSNPRYRQQDAVNLCFELLLEGIQSEDLLESVLYGIGHNNEILSEKQISVLIKFKNQENIDVKQSLISALSGIENADAIDVLIKLTRDEISSVRDWSTFAIGSMIETDNQNIRNALWDRLNDIDSDTKMEAVVGLANRNDNRIKNVILSILESGEFGTLLFEAILTLNDKDFLPLLNKNLENDQCEDDIFGSWIDKLKETIEELEASTD